MVLLDILEGIRNPILDVINLLFTVMGEELFFIGILCLIFWCIDKQFAYRICFIYVISGIFIQGLKITFRVERPFVTNTELSPVKAAKGSATGYSFPSGHVQNTTALFTTFSHRCINKIYKFLLLIPIILVMFSRMYLGVHTPLDVVCSFILTVIITLIINYIYDNFMLDESHQKWVYVLFLAFIILTTVYSIYINTTIADINTLNMCDIFKACGASLGFITGWILEIKFIKFNEKAARLPLQSLKYLLGIILLAGLKVSLKFIFDIINIEMLSSGFIQNFILTLFITSIYPLLIKRFFSPGKH